MKTSRIIILRILLSVGLVLACFRFVEAQDPEPAKTALDSRSRSAMSKELRALMSFAPIPDNPMPKAFRDTVENVITDPTGSLYTFFDKLAGMDRPVRIVHIGDSHIRGHVLPYVMRQSLEEDFGADAVEDIPVTYSSSGLARETGEPGIVYHILGVNGATCGTFATPERLKEIVGLSPDLVIVSFGTNEAHGRNYSSEEHRTSLDKMLSAIKAECPETVFLLTTPPGAYVRGGKQGRTVNPRTPKVVETELDYASRSGLAIWNLYEIAGGKRSACKNWTSGGYFQKDKIHFTHEGYRVQGKLLHEAFIKAYNGYVAAGLE